MHLGYRRQRLAQRFGTLALLLLTVPAPPLVAANPASAPGAEAGQLARALNAVRSITTLRADFDQTDANGQHITGVFTLKQPEKFRFQYQAGYPMLIVSDGHALAVIDYEVRQVQRFPLRYTPVGALLDPRRDVSHIAHVQPTDDPNSISVVIHDRGHRESGDMTILFVRDSAAPGGLAIAGWATIDAQNARTIVRLSHPQYGVEVGDDLFKWSDPRKHTQK